MKWLLFGLCMQHMMCSFGAFEDFISTLEQEPYFKGASIGIYITNEKGEVILDYQGEKSLIPNSILKLFTTAAALESLGKEFRFHTQLFGSGVIREGVLTGDCIILGDGDPTLGNKEEEELLLWAKSLKNKGVTSITGSVIGDASCFERALSPASWLWEDLGNYYGSGACGLNFHENTSYLTFKLGEQVGEATQLLHIKPQLPGVTMVNEVLSAHPGSGDQASIFGGEFSNVQYIRGTLPIGDPLFTIRGSIPDPALCCAAQFAKALEKEGVSVGGGARSSFDKNSYPNKCIFYDSYSPKLAEMVIAANRFSINLYCESFLKKMGQGTHVKGLEVITQYLKGLNINLEGIRILDGSGLSGKNLVTAKAMVDFLSKVAKKPYFPILLDSLPNMGQESSRLPSKRLKGRVCAKTGYSSQGESLAGFLTNDRGERVQFCVIVNHFLGPRSTFWTKITSLFELLLMH